MKETYTEEEAEIQKSLETCIVNRKSKNLKQVAGHEVVIQSLQEAIVLPFKFPEFFQGDRKPWKAILLYG